MDRCATDAVQSVTGCSLGKRTMKFMDFGKMAATFVNLRTGKGRPGSGARGIPPEGKRAFPAYENKYAGQLEAYRTMNDEDLFEVMPVQVQLQSRGHAGKAAQQGRVRCVRRACSGRAGGPARWGRSLQSLRGKRLLHAGGCFFLMRALCKKVITVWRYGPKIWIETDGEPVFGRGRRFLLEAIDSSWFDQPGGKRGRHLVSQGVGPYPGHGEAAGDLARGASDRREERRRRDADARCPDVPQEVRDDGKGTA